MNRGQPHKLHSEKVCQSAEPQDRKHKASDRTHWPECDLGISKYITDNEKCICITKVHDNFFFSARFWGKNSFMMYIM